MSQIVVGTNQKVHFVPPVTQFVGSAYQGEIAGMYWMTREATRLGRWHRLQQIVELC
jgi:hypothetical protein